MAGGGISEERVTAMFQEFNGRMLKEMTDLANGLMSQTEARIQSKAKVITDQLEENLETANGAFKIEQDRNTDEMNLVRTNFGQLEAQISAVDSMDRDVLEKLGAKLADQQAADEQRLVVVRDFLMTGINKTSVDFIEFAASTRAEFAKIRNGEYGAQGTAQH